MVAEEEFKELVYGGSLYEPGPQAPPPLTISNHAIVVIISIYNLSRLYLVLYLYCIFAVLISIASYYHAHVSVMANGLNYSIKLFNVKF